MDWVRALLPQVEAALEEKRVLARKVAEGKIRNIETKKENEAIRLAAIEAKRVEMEQLKVHEVRGGVWLCSAAPFPGTVAAHAPAYVRVCVLCVCCVCCVCAGHTRPTHAHI
jgi:hypothetical protein